MRIQQRLLAAPLPSSSILNVGTPIVLQMFNDPRGSESHETYRSAEPRRDGREFLHVALSGWIQRLHK